MTHSARARTNSIGFLAVGLVSALSMIWLLWRFPLGTAVAAILVFAAFGVSARLARLVETDGSRGSRAR